MLGGLENTLPVVQEHEPEMITSLGVESETVTKIPATEIPEIGQSRKPPVTLKFEEPVRQIWDHSKLDFVGEQALGGNELPDAQDWEFEEAYAKDKIKYNKAENMIYVKLPGLLEEAKISSKTLEKAIEDGERKNVVLKSILEKLKS